METSTLLLNSKADVKRLRELINQALAPICDDNGITLEIGTIRYAQDGSTATMRLTALAGTGADAARIDYDRHCKCYGLERDNYGDVFTFKDEDFAISGISPRSPKFPILAKNVRTGVTFKFRDVDVIRALERRVALV